MYYEWQEYDLVLLQELNEYLENISNEEINSNSEEN